MSSTVAPYRWSVSEFLRAWEAGAFDHRVELVEGEVWPVVNGDWHGKTTGAANGCAAAEVAVDDLLGPEQEL